MAKLKDELKLAREDILKGSYGQSGEEFMTVREYAAKRNISYVTAHSVFVKLREQNLLTLVGKKHFVTSGVVGQDSAIRKRLGSARPIVGLHLNDISNPFFGMLAQRLESELFKSGFELLIITSNFNPEREISALKYFLELGAAGIISNPGQGKASDYYKTYALPSIFIGRGIDDKNTVLVNNYESGMTAAKHLLKQSYNKFAYIGLQHLSPASDSRLRGFRHHMNEQGYELAEENIFYVSDSNITSYTSCKNFLKKITGQDKVGIFCYHDIIAAEMLVYCKLFNLNIPNQVGVIGFDNLQVAHMTNPSLTTFSYNYALLAQTAVKMLESLIANPAKSIPNISISTNFLVRESTVDLPKPSNQT